MSGLRRRVAVRKQAAPGNMPAFDVSHARLVRRAFFDRDPRQVCPELLGKIIVRREGRKVLAGRIVELEAYLGADDAAAHAAAGRTARNDVLWGPPGHAYIYFIYGVHYCLNISCMPEGEAGCVLVRALEPLSGIKQMALARHMQDLDFNVNRNVCKLASGPGKLSEALGITRERDNGKDMLSSQSDLQVLDDGHEVDEVETTVRIGITKSADMPLRYLVAGNPCISVRLKSKPVLK